MPLDSATGSFTVAFAPGVTPGKWERVWSDRMRRQRLELVPLSNEDALAAVRDGSAHMGLLRDVGPDDDLHAIALYREQPVVVAPKDHAVTAFDELSLADLADEVVLDGQDADTIELVAANVGVAIMPMSVARGLSRKDVTSRPLTDAPDTGVSLVWLRATDDPRVDSFIGIVRGRTANSSR